MSLVARSAFRFSRDGAPMLQVEDWMLDVAAGITAAVVPEVPAPGERQATSLAAAEPAPTIPADPVPAAVGEVAPPVVAAPPPEAVPPPPIPAAPEPPPLQSQAELDLFALFAHLADGFNGDQALADLLASDWAAQNGWQGAGGGPIA